MHRPLTLVIMLAVLAGALSFLGTLLSAPGQVDARLYGSQVRAAMGAGDWALVAKVSRAAVRQAPRMQEALLFQAFAEDRTGSQSRADYLWARLERVSRENIRRGNDSAEQWYYLGWGLSGQGYEEGARAAWRDLVRQMSPREEPYNRVCYLTLAGETEAALEAWERLAEAPVGVDWRWARVDPDLEGIRGDPRFEEARQRARQLLRQAVEEETRI